MHLLVLLSVILIKLEFGASVGFIHKESVTMHGQTITKLRIKTFSKKIYIYIISNKHEWPKSSGI